MSRFGIKIGDLVVMVSSHGYYEIYRGEEMICRGNSDEMGIKYDPEIDSFADPKFHDDAVMKQRIEYFMANEFKPLIKQEIKKLEELL